MLLVKSSRLLVVLGYRLGWVDVRLIAEDMGWRARGRGNGEWKDIEVHPETKSKPFTPSPGAGLLQTFPFRSV